jgi:hypothetical protein
MIVSINKKTMINRETVMVEIEKVPLGGISVIDLCRLNNDDPPLSFERDLGIPPPLNKPSTYKSPELDTSTYWQPGVHI